MICINGAYFERLNVGGGEHFAISAARKEEKLVYYIFKTKLSRISYQEYSDAQLLPVSEPFPLSPK